MLLKSLGTLNKCNRCCYCLEIRVYQVFNLHKELIGQAHMFLKFSHGHLYQLERQNFSAQNENYHKVKNIFRQWHINLF